MSIPETSPTESIVTDAPIFKACSRCRERKPADAFYVRSDRPSQLMAACKVCRGLMQVEQRRRAVKEGCSRRQERSADGQAGRLVSNRRWQEKNVERVRTSDRARSVVRRALTKGALVRPDVCELCGSASTRIEAAHSDYSRPLDVRWLCLPCHRRWDRAEPKTIAVEVVS